MRYCVEPTNWVNINGVEMTTPLQWLDHYDPPAIDLEDEAFCKAVEWFTKNVSDIRGRVGEELRSIWEAGIRWGRTNL